MTTNSKEWIQYLTASLMIVSGVVLTFISFFADGKKKERWREQIYLNNDKDGIQRETEG